LIQTKSLARNPKRVKNQIKKDEEKSRPVRKHDNGIEKGHNTVLQWIKE